MMERNTLAEVINAATAASKVGLHVSLPGRVVGFNGITQTADVQVAVELPLAQSDGSQTWEDLGTLFGVPIQYPSGGGFYMAFPLAPGDPVTLVFSDVATGEWFDGKGDGVARPADGRRHSLGYAVAIPGARPVQAAGPDPGAALVIGSELGDGRAKFTAGEIELGRGASDYVALASSVDARFSAVRTNLNAHVHGGVTTGAGASAVSTTPLAALASVAATVVKAK